MLNYNYQLKEADVIDKATGPNLPFPAISHPQQVSNNLNIAKCRSNIT